MAKPWFFAASPTAVASCPQIDWRCGWVCWLAGGPFGSGLVQPCPCWHGAGALLSTALTAQLAGLVSERPWTTASGMDGAAGGCSERAGNGTIVLLPRAMTFSFTSITAPFST